jgi:hypothetical protein
MRKIDLDLKLAIDDAGRSNPDFVFATEQKLWRPIMSCVAKAFADTTEDTNSNDGDLIKMMQKTVDGNASGEAYCMAFVQTVIAYVESSLSMRSPLISTEGVLALWNSPSTAPYKNKSPLPGYIAIWQHGQSSNGHSGIVIRVTDSYFKCIEANSHGPDGITQGIFVHDRLFSGDGNMRLLGFLSPF